MSFKEYNLAIETSSRQGSVALGCGDTLLAIWELPPPARHRVDLLPTIADLCSEHDLRAIDLKELYVSIGPGSFTGLRIAVTTVKVIAQMTGSKIVAVPTLDAVAEASGPLDQPLVVCRNRKRETVYCGRYRHEAGRWELTDEPDIRTNDQLAELSVGAVVLDEDAKVDAGSAWKCGRRMASEQQWTEPLALSPLYAREPEAVTLWEENKHKRATHS